MEPEQTEEAFVVDKSNVWNTVTPLSKYLALALFVALPFIGGWVGYTFAPKKVVEVEKIVEVQKSPNAPEPDTESRAPHKYIENNETNLRTSGIESELNANTQSPGDKETVVATSDLDAETRTALKELYGDRFGEGAYTNSTFGYTFDVVSPFYIITKFSDQKVELHSDEPEWIKIEAVVTNKIENFSELLASDIEFKVSQLSNGLLYNTVVNEKAVGTQGRTDLETYLFWEENTTGRLLMIEFTTVIHNTSPTDDFDRQYANLIQHKQQVIDTLSIHQEAFLEQQIEDMKI